MDILLNHWHCILPVAAIVFAILLMAGGPKKKTADKESRGTDE